MAFIKEHKIFAGILLGLLAVFVTSSVLTFNAMQAADKAGKRALAQYRSLESVMAIYPAPTRTNRERVAEELQRYREALGQSLAVFQSARRIEGSSDAVEVLPKVQGLIVDLRREANAAGVTISEDASFSFARYREEVAPPPPETIPLLDKQIQIIQPLVSLLIASEPEAIIQVFREYVEAGDPNQREPGRPIPDAPGTFIIAPEETARVPDALETLAFQLIFEGYTQSLRNLLNKLSDLNLPLVVRDIRVSPASGSGSLARQGENSGGGSGGDESASPFSSLFGDADAAPPPGAETPESDEPEQVPIIEDNQSRFTVTLEFIEITLDMDAARETIEEVAE